MSVALNLPPSEIERLSESPATLDAVRRAHADRWSTECELLAGLYEMAHMQYIATLAAAGMKSRDLPKPIKVPRPYDKAKATKKTATGAELRQWVMNRRGGD
jgi:hypothetical protein